MTMPVSFNMKVVPSIFGTSCGSRTTSRTTSPARPMWPAEAKIAVTEIA